MSPWITGMIGVAHTMEPMYIRDSSVGGNWHTPTTEIPFHPDMENGDLLILSVISGGSECYCDDPRMTLLVDTNINGRDFKVYYGYASNVGNPVSIFTQGLYNATRQFAGAHLVAFRAAEGSKPLVLAPNRLATVVNASGYSPDLPGLPLSGSGAIVIMGYDAWIGGVGGDLPARAEPIYQYVATGGQAYWRSQVYLSTRHRIPQTPSPGGHDWWTAVVVGLK